MRTFPGGRAALEVVHVWEGLDDQAEHILRNKDVPVRSTDEKANNLSLKNTVCTRFGLYSIVFFLSRASRHVVGSSLFEPDRA